MNRKERPPLKQAEAVAGLLRKVLGDRGFDERLPRYRVWLVWDKVVGEQIAARARPLRVRDKILEVRVDHPVWMQQLQMLKPQILKKLREQLPDCDIEEIYLRRGNPQPRQREESAEQLDWQRQELSEAEQQEIDRILEDVADPELKGEMRRLFSRQKQLEKVKNSDH